MSDSAVDKATFAFLASCVGDFARWPQCTHVSLRDYKDGARTSRGFFRALAANPNNRAVFKIIVTKGSDWRVRVIQLSNHVLLDEPVADRATLVNAMNRFAELAGVRESENHD